MLGKLSFSSDISPMIQDSVRSKQWNANEQKKKNEQNTKSLISSSTKMRFKSNYRYWLVEHTDVVTKLIRCTHYNDEAHQKQISVHTLQETSKARHHWQHIYKYMRQVFC